VTRQARGGSPATRVELVWPGKRTEVERRAAPLRLIERVDGSAAPATPREWRNLLIAGDNKPAMASLLTGDRAANIPSLAGAIDLIAIDPPFDSGGHVLRPAARRAAAPDDAFGPVAFPDRWGGDGDCYLQMMYDRLVLMRELLSPTGSLYVHCDASASHYLKVLLDGIFGRACFQREIVWRVGWVSGFKSAARNYVRNHDTILFYTRHPRRFCFNKEYVPHPQGYQRRRGDAGKGYPLEDVWNAHRGEAALTGCDSLDSIQIKSFSREKTGYPTQKNESLLRRIIRTSSNPGDLVADFFLGSGTTAAAAHQLGRRWIGCDVGKLAIATADRRLRGLGASFDLLTLDAADCRSTPAPGPRGV